MSHNIQYASYPLSVKKIDVQEEWDEYVRHEDWQEGASGTPNPIRWVDRTFPNYDAAQQYIEEQDRRIWYNCMAVKYETVKRDALRASKPSKKEEELSAQIKATMDSLNKIEKQASIQNRTSEYIGCEKCGSKLKRTLLKSEYCPLCRNDLRSKTNLERMANARKKADELRDRREALEKKRVEDLKKTSREVKWLVKIEYHT